MKEHNLIKYRTGLFIFKLYRREQESAAAQQRSKPIWNELKTSFYTQEFILDHHGGKSFIRLPGLMTY